MRGKPESQPPMFFVIDVEKRVRVDHPLRPIKKMVDEELAAMSEQFDALYARTGRPSVPPERLLKALLLMALYSVRSEAQLVERIDTDLLFRWFLDMDPQEAAFDSTAFTHNRPRLEKHGIVSLFFGAVVKRAVQRGLTSDEHFSVDGTLIESYASIKSFVPKEQSGQCDDGGSNDGNAFKPRNAEVNFHGQKRSNGTHASKTDPQARLYKKSAGTAAKLYHAAHAITENRHGLVMAVELGSAGGEVEPAAAVSMVDGLKERLGVKVITLGSDKGYDGGPYLIELENRGVTPHSALRAGETLSPQQIRRRHQKDRAAIAARERMRERQSDTGYTQSQRCRKKIEEAFGWLKTVANLYRTRLVGHWKIKQQLQLAAAAYNLVRLRKLAA